MKIYVIQNSAGKFFRPRGYQGSGEQWQDTIEKAKFYTKVGAAKTQCTVWYNTNPKYGCPHILEFDIDPSKATKIDMLEHAMKSADRKAKKQALRDAEYKMFTQVQNMAKVREIMKTLTPQQKKALGLSY